MKLRILGIATAIGCLAMPVIGSAYAGTATEAEDSTLMAIGIDSYIDEQLHPETIPLPARARSRPVEAQTPDD